MLQLIIGITLGIILLFVIMLLITEMASTYPVWKHFEKSPKASLPAYTFTEKKEKEPGNLRALLLVLLCITGFGVAIFLIVSSPSQGVQPVSERPAYSGRTPEAPPTAPAVSLERRLTDISTVYGLMITLQTKWADGKIYGNSRVSFEKTPVPNVTDWRFSLLDKDGFLIREFHFSANDFVFETGANEQITGLLNRFNADMSLKEYQRIDRLQVVVDKKLSSQ